jgi:His/Glu/Gln/Arg/opine family amino acid ABC transporter permease subunit
MVSEQAARPSRGLEWARHESRPVAVMSAALGGTALGVVILGTMIVVAVHGLVPWTDVADALSSPELRLEAGAAIALGVVAMALGWGTYRRMPTRLSREEAVAGAVLGVQAALLGAVVLWFSHTDVRKFALNFANFEQIQDQIGAFVTGARNTIFLAAGGEFIGIVLGLVLVLLAISHRAVVRAPARVYINFFRGTPLIWQLVAGYFLLLFGFGVRLSAFTAAIIVFALNTGAYAAEVFRAGIQSIERGQIEAARSLGMSYSQAMRYAIVPQAVRRVIPPLMNEFVILIKDTALVIALGLTAANYDIFTTAREGQSATFNSTFFTVAAIAYLIVTLPLIRLVNAAEKRLRSGLVGVAGAGG